METLLKKLKSKYFVHARFKNSQKDKNLVIEVRPVSIRGKKRVQIVTYKDKKALIKNYSFNTLDKEIEKLLENRFENIYIKTTKNDYRMKRHKDNYKTKTLKPTVQKVPVLSHNLKKDVVLKKDKKYEFLVAIGVQTKEGKIRHDKWDKFNQINRFLKLIADSIDIKFFGKTVRIVDLGCGNAYLTYAVYYYFTRVLKKKTSVLGVDTRYDLIKKHNKISKGLGWKGLEFFTSTIADFDYKNVDIVIALHACDTATDDALAKAITWRAKYIFASPCCHNYLNKQITRKKAPPELIPLLRHSILKERLGDMLTDTFRSLALFINGYKTDVFEFISKEHTSKNLMIRANKTNTVDKKNYKKEYEGLKNMWSVEPYLDNLTKL